MHRTRAFLCIAGLLFATASTASALQSSRLPARTRLTPGPPTGKLPAHWDLSFGLRGPIGFVNEIATFDNGMGSRAYFGDSVQSLFSPTTTQIFSWKGNVATTSRFLAGPCCSNPSRLDVALFYLGGNGPLLLLGGDFTEGLLKFDGQTYNPWPTGAPPGNGVRTITADGSDLLAGSNALTSISLTQQVRRWNGDSWEDLGALLPDLHALAISSAGGSRAFYAASSGNVLRFDGTDWVPIPDPFTALTSLVDFDDGARKLLVAGGPNEPLQAWDGSTWSLLGGLAAPRGVTDLAVFVEDTRDTLFVAGTFENIGGVPFQHLASWDGTRWNDMSGGVDAAPTSISVDATTGKVYVAGPFSAANGVSAPQLARWDAAGWEALGDGEGLLRGADSSGPRSSGFAEVLETLDLGAGPELFVAGDFTSAGSSPAPGIARWRGSFWSPLGAGFDGSAVALAAYDSGSGPELWAAGSLRFPGIFFTQQLARFDGIAWQPVPGISGTIQALQVFDAGGGPELIAAGTLTQIGGTSVSAIARFDGTGWSPLGAGTVNGTIDSLKVHDDGAGPKLYAGGDFTSIGGISASGVASWDGTRWSAVGSGFEVSSSFDAVLTLDSLFVPSLGGTRLFAGGGFSRSGSGVTLDGIGMWDGTDWLPVGEGGTGFRANGFGRRQVHGLTSFDEGDGARLIATGEFSFGPNHLQENVARFDGTSWVALPDLVAGRARDSTVLAGDLWICGSVFTTSQTSSNGVARRLPKRPRWTY